MRASDPAPSFREGLTAWARIAALSFGGPAGQIAVMHRVLVEERGWLDEKRFLHGLNFCMLLPGPEAQQMAAYAGWLTHGVRGALAAGLLFVIPGAISVFALSWLYAAHGDLGWVSALFFGLKAGVLAIVLRALARIAGKALAGRADYALAGAAFMALFAFGLPFPAVVLAAALIGWLRARRKPGAPGAALDVGTRPGTRLAALAAAVLWVAPTLALLIALGRDHVFTRIALFFSQMAVLSFGGAYAALVWVAQAAVEGHGWLRPGEMLDGLAMAETTPGPLIMATQFVGFLAAWRDPGGLSPLTAGALGALLTSWVVFAPCFLWIFLCAPHVERLRANAAVSGALAAVTAAVVGVILNLALWFALHALFGEPGRVVLGPVSLPAPRWSGFDPVAAILSALALFAAFGLKWGVARLIAASALAGLAAQAIL